MKFWLGVFKNAKNNVIPHSHLNNLITKIQTNGIRLSTVFFYGAGQRQSSGGYWNSGKDKW